jgi:hypothetical protein
MAHSHVSKLPWNLVGLADPWSMQPKKRYIKMPLGFFVFLQDIKSLKQIECRSKRLEDLDAVTHPRIFTLNLHYTATLSHFLKQVPTTPSIYIMLRF